MTDSLARALSDRTVKAARSKDAPYKLTDGGGLFLLVQPGGSKLWRYKFRIDGKERLLLIGGFPDIGLSDARRLHAEARKLVAAGIDPVAQRRQDREQAEAEKRRLIASSFENVQKAWQDLTDDKIAKSTAAQRRRELVKHVTPKIASKPLQRPSRAPRSTDYSRGSAHKRLKLPVISAAT